MFVHKYVDWSDLVATKSVSVAPKGFHWTQTINMMAIVIRVQNMGISGPTEKDL